MDDYFPTLRQLLLIRQYPDDNDLALDMIFKNRYKPPYICPKCNKKTRFYRVNDRKSYSCQLCGKHISPLAGTIFEKSTTPLATWFLIIHDIYISNGQIPVKELERKYRIRYATAWRCKHLICAHLRINKSYLYKYSSKKNGRYYQLNK